VVGIAAPPYVVVKPTRVEVLTARPVVPQGSRGGRDRWTAS